MCVCGGGGEGFRLRVYSEQRPPVVSGNSHSWTGKSAKTPSLISSDNYLGCEVRRRAKVFRDEGFFRELLQFTGSGLRSPPLKPDWTWTYNRHYWPKSPWTKARLRTIFVTQWWKIHLSEWVGWIVWLFSGHCGPLVKELKISFFCSFHLDIDMKDS